jgi:hypothetical protein
MSYRCSVELVSTLATYIKKKYMSELTFIVRPSFRYLAIPSFTASALERKEIVLFRYCDLFDHREWGRPLLAR